MGAWTEFKLEGLFVNWAAVIISNVSAYMTVFINTVYFHISKLSTSSASAGFAR